MNCSPFSHRLPRRSLVSRADLLDCLEGREDAEPLAMERMAEFLGFEVRSKGGEQAKLVSPTPPGQPELHGLSAIGTSVVHKPAQPPQARFLRVVGYQPVPPEERVTEMPAELAGASPLTGADPIDSGHRPPSTPPLAPWSRLWPFLKKALGDRSHSRHMDISKLVALLAEGRWPRRLPRLIRQGWASRAQVLLDANQRLCLFRDDFHDLCLKLQALRGRGGVEILVFEQGPEGPCRAFGDYGDSAYSSYKTPTPETRVLVLSDLGGAEGHGGHAWRRLGARLKQAGVRPTALLPEPVRRWPLDWTAFFRPVVWDRGVRLAPARAAARPDLTGPEAEGSLDILVPLPEGTTSREEGKSPGIRRLLRLMSLAVRVEPGLLRALRYLLSPWEADVGSEAEAWCHPDVRTGLLGLVLRPAAIERYREEARREESPELLEKAAALIRAWHGHLSQAILAEESLIQAEILGKEPEPSAVDFLRSMLVTVMRQPRNFSHQAGLEAWVQRVAGRQHPAFWRSHQADPVAAALAVIRERTPEHKAGDLPKGFDPNRVLWALGQPPNPVVMELRLKQFDHVRDSALLELAIPPLAGQYSDAPSPLGRLTVSGMLTWHYSGNDGLILSPQPGWRFSASTKDRILLRSSHETLELRTTERPAWAKRIGQDEYGLFADFEYQGITQRFRWIPPGRFWMGSPEDEPERSSDEVRHEVIISQGYWLADTACTQALWMEVMGKNPSQFKGDDRPVEKVSWNEVKKFIDRLNSLGPGLEVRLPTEAEWEYACRAGTETPFWFGANITPEQVNYDGSYPYTGGRKGLYREETVDVNALPCNVWGLYKMLGNVWEWCEDWYGEYPHGSASDPTGPFSGESRVLRGGSWDDGPWDCRSANRDWLEQEGRSSLVGFRVAIGLPPGKLPVRVL